MTEETNSSETTCEETTTGIDTSKSRFLDALEKKKLGHRIRDQEKLSIGKLSREQSIKRTYKVHRRKSG